MILLAYRVQRKIVPLASYPNILFSLFKNAFGKRSVSKIRLIIKQQLDRAGKTVVKEKFLRYFLGVILFFGWVDNFH